MNVTIVSIQAVLHGRAPIVWMGEIIGEDLGIDDQAWTHEAMHEQICEALFRFFNRVDDADSDRLAEVGYNLPSLSVGDLISWDHVTYRVAGMGFEKLTDSGEYAMALTAYTLRTMSGPTKAEIERGI